MQNTSSWIRCPFCGRKTRAKIYPDTIVFRFPIYCPKCKQETKIDVTELKIAISK
ncbi:MAG TPA: conjugal transfer protein [Candidatus Faecousia faecipullorum]|nr:conjugal transfer protein [Candidatus Faecousia faecipullorum]